MRWFDADDEQSPGPDSLRGVVHFMSGIQARDGGIALHIDLGSSPASALDDLLFALADARLLRVSLST